MNLTDLRERATAAELVLIDKVKALVKLEVRDLIITETLKFISAHNPPSREDCIFNKDAPKNWINALNKHLKETN